MIYFVDLEQGNDSALGNSFGQRWLTFTNLQGALQPGDTVLVMETPAPQSPGITSTWTPQIPSVGFSAPLNVTIMDGGTQWVSNTSWCSVTADTSLFKSISSSVLLTIGTWSSAPYPAAYATLTTPVIINGYQQVSFWLMADGAIAANQIKVRLCGDTLGQSDLFSAYIPAMDCPGTWVPVVLTGSSTFIGQCKSVSVNVESDPTPTANINIDNIVVCNAPGATAITHNTLIGNQNSLGAGPPNGSNTDTWYAIQWISPSGVRIDNGPMDTPSKAFGWFGASGSGPLYTIEPFLSPLASASLAPVFTFASAGTISSLVNWQFGMDSNSMSVQSGQTWFSGQNGYGLGFQIAGDFQAISGAALVRYYHGLYIHQSHGGQHTFPAIGHCAAENIFVNGPSSSNTLAVNALYNGTSAGYNDQPNGGNNDLQFSYVVGNGGYGAIIASNDYLHDGIYLFNGESAVYANGAVVIDRITTAGNGRINASGTAGSGITGTYYSQWTFAGTEYTEIDPAINFDWGYSPPVPGFPTTYWNARWIGWITPLYTEPYTFTVHVDDGARLWINGVLLIDNWVIQIAHDIPSTATITLQAGVPAQIQVDYQQGPSISLIWLYWQSPSQAKQIIPASAYSVNLPSVAAVTINADACIGYDVDLHDCVFGESTPFAGFENYHETRVRSHNHNIVGNHLMMTDGGVVTNETGIYRHTQSGYAWKLQPSAPRSSLYPLDYEIASFAVTNGTPCTITAWFMSTDSSITGQLVLTGGQIDGVPNDVVSTLTVAGSYQQLSITFTPTEVGVVNIYARVFGGTSSAIWVDDMGISQS